MTTSWPHTDRHWLLTKMKSPIASPLGETLCSSPLFPHELVLCQFLEGRMFSGVPAILFLPYMHILHLSMARTDSRHDLKVMHAIWSDETSLPLFLCCPSNFLTPSTQVRPPRDPVPHSFGRRTPQRCQRYLKTRKSKERVEGRMRPPRS